MQPDVVIYETEKKQYPSKMYLFRPSERYPEYDFDELAEVENDVYNSVREAIHLFGYDNEHYGTKEWNPFGAFINENIKVLIKPNLVMDYNRSGEGTDCLYTNPSVIAPIIDYVIKAQKGKGHIIIGDAPMQECKFDILIKESGLEDLITFYRSKGINVELMDFRELKSEVIMGTHKQVVNERKTGVIVDLKTDSEFFSCREDELKRLRITNYDPRRLAMHHNSEKHEYYVSKYLLEADVVINMPKPKTHRKAGVTIAMKNMVGINTRKEFLPHHTTGSIKSGGDECRTSSFIRVLSDKLYDYKNMKEGENKNLLALPAFIMAYGLKLLANCLHKEQGEGNWSGNHTISRTINDLNKIMMYCDKKGKMCENQQRKVIVVADMIIAGEKEGPVMPSPKELGVIAIGENQLIFDTVIATLMGADVSKLPTLTTAMHVQKYAIKNAKEPLICSNIAEHNGVLRVVEKKLCWGFVPTSGWKDAFF